MRRCCGRRMKWRAAVLAGMLGAAATVAATDVSRAQGFFDFLFGGPQRPPPPPQPLPAPPSAGIGRVAPAPLGPESVREGSGSTGHGVAFCVRLCDGQHFPLEQMANATPAETCHAICPASATKVYFGSEIGAAVAGDGARYADLNTAFLYRKHLVASCTCNGRDAFGLATLDVKTDPTLRPGDIVSTKDGFVTYSGKSGQAAAFTPANPSALRAQSSAAASRPPPANAAPAEIDDDPGTIGPPAATPQNAAPAASQRVPNGR